VLCFWATSRRFASKGFRVALLARNANALNKFTGELKAQGAQAAAFPVATYDASEIQSAFKNIKKEWPNAPLRVAVWNASSGVFKKFSDVTAEDLQGTVESSVNGPFAFSKEAINAFKEVDVDDRGTRGTLIFTNATAGTRGNILTSAFAAGKFALRALSQSLAKTYGQDNIHVANVILDGIISTDRNPGGDTNERLSPEAIAETYEFLANQHHSAYTWELDLRPAHEKW